MSKTGLMGSITSISLRGNFTLGVAKKQILLIALAFLFCWISVSVSWFAGRYQFDTKMQVDIKELSNVEYPANPAALSQNFHRYSKRRLKIFKTGKSQFDFFLEPTDEKTATIVLKNLDLSLLTPQAPQWVKHDGGLETIAFTDREWNRQQVSFPADSKHIEIWGGDGFEKQNLAEIAVANNCLNAGLWEILLFTKENNNKSLYYQVWFAFPIGHYKNSFEQINNLSYWKHWWRLEHWQDPSGTVVQPNLLRQVLDETEVNVQFPTEEKIVAAGEQSRKVRTTLAKNLRTWSDFYTEKNEIKFATFRSPGFYDPHQPWGNEYWKIGRLKKAILRQIKPVGVSQNLQEIELVFGDTKTGETNRLFFSGIDLNQLPRLSVDKYPLGLYMPMGIGVPPFYQTYEELERNPPARSPYFSVLLDANNRWLDHHKLAVDGVAMHLDSDTSNLLHLYLLSYERNTLIAHFLIDWNG